ncbi:hypothetical protein ACHAWX_006606 [Stephanocyclus meneghinianus]
MCLVACSIRCGNSGHRGSDRLGHGSAVQKSSGHHQPSQSKGPQHDTTTPYRFQEPHKNWRGILLHVRFSPKNLARDIISNNKSNIQSMPNFTYSSSTQGCTMLSTPNEVKPSPQNASSLARNTNFINDSQ